MYSRRLGLGRRAARGWAAASSGPPVPPFDAASLVLRGDLMTSGPDVTGWLDQSLAGYVFATTPPGVTVGALAGQAAPDLSLGASLRGFNAQTGAFLAASGFDVFGLFALDAADNGGPAYYDAPALLSNLDGWAALCVSPAEGVIGGFNTTGGADPQIVDPANYVDGAPHVVRWTYDPGAGEMRMRVDANAAPAPVPVADPPRAMPEDTIIGRNWSGVAFLDGTLQLFAWPLLSDLEAAAFYAWLASTYPGLVVP